MKAGARASLLKDYNRIHGRPSVFLSLTEGPRTLWDLAMFTGSGSVLNNEPQGDGHAVLVIPGFMMGDGSTYFLRHFLKGLGYRTHGWGLGRNYGPRKGLRKRLASRLESLYHRYNGKISIVGQSLGGIYAREIAREAPEHIRQVITLGSPFGGGRGRGSATRFLFDTISDKEMQRLTHEYMAKSQSPTYPVPSSAIYSKMDGIVHWRDCIQKAIGKAAGLSENIEVMCSHCGMGVHPAVLHAVADRLAQAEGEWEPFMPKGYSPFLAYPEPEPVSAS